MNERKRIEYKEHDIHLAMDILEEIKDIVEFFVFIRKERGSIISFILIDGVTENSNMLIDHRKRETDVLIALPRHKNINLIITQETNAAGNQVFAEKILKELSKASDGNAGAFATILNFKDGDIPPVKNIVYSLVEDFVNISRQPTNWREQMVSHKDI